MSKLISIIALVVFSLSVSPTFGQYGGNGPTPAPLAQGRPAGRYQLSDIENINYFSGHLNITIPLAGRKGRGGSSNPVSVSFDSPSWTAYMDYIDDNTNNGGRAPASFAQYAFVGKVSGLPYAEIKVQYSSFDPVACLGSGLYSGIVARISVKMHDGTDYEFRDTQTDGKPQEMPGCYNFPYRGQEFITKDGSKMKYVTDSAVQDAPYGSTGSAAGYLYLPDGTVFCFGVSGYADWMRDRNGNVTSYDLGSSPDFVNTITDSIGRKITSNYFGTGLPGDVEINYYGTNGQDREVSLISGELADNLRSGEVFLSIEDLFESFHQIWGYDRNNSVITAVNLPNGQSLELKYNTYGEIAWMKLPTGGIVEYDWTDGAGGTGGQVDSGLVANTFIYRRLVERRVYADGVNLSSKTTISRPEVDQVGYVDVKTYAPDLVSVERHYYFGSASSTFHNALNNDTYFYPSWKTGREYKTEILNPTDSALLRKVEHTWEQTAPTWWTSSCGYCAGGDADKAPPNNPRITETKTTLENSSISKQSFTYDSTQRLTDTYEYDYGSGSAGSLLRRTHTDYLTTNAVNSTNYTTGSLYILNLPSAKWVSTDSAGSNKVSLTQFEYDNYASDSNHAGLVSRSSVVGHDTTNFGTGFTYRGNLTGATSYANAGAQTGGVTAYSQFDMLGNIVKTIDANGNATTISFGDNFGTPDSNATTNSAPSVLNGLNTFAFPTITENSMNWISHLQYDYYTGSPVNAKDINDLISKTSYNDDLDRPTQSVSAIGTANEIQATTEYDDTNHKVMVTGDLFALNDNLSKAETLYDGLGRTVEQRSYSEGDYVSVKTEFDGLGRIKKISNPFRPTRSETPVWTETTYDALGRIAEDESPDGSIAVTLYDGNRTLVIDQAARKRVSRVNALGQLKDVWEITPADSSTESVTSFPTHTLSAGYRTSYTFDGLGNLTEVTQGAQTRTFIYDNLSRLLSAANPESGTISYTYSAGGNLKTKRDARNIKTVYDYDVLNRLTNRCYRSIGTGSLGMATCASNTETQEPNTSDVTYTYENSSITSLKNVLTKIENGISVTEYVGFDATGRVTRTKQTADGVVYGDDTSPMTYTYSLSGALLEQKYPSGRVVKNVLDQDGKLAVLQSKKNQNTGYWSYASSFTYNGAGAVTSMQRGNGRWESTTFNSQLQPTQIALGVTSGATNLLDLDYEYGELNPGTGQTIAGTNNGNVSKQTITVASVGATPGFVSTQYYGYEALNRIQVATESITPTGGSLTLSWRQGFSYDRYGNKNFITSGDYATTTLGSCSTAVCNPAISTSNNQLTSTGYSFDAAGNTTRDAQDRKFTYNGENKQVKVESLSPGTETVTGTVGEYFYDGDGKRVKKYVPSTGETTIFVFDAAGKLVEEYSTVVASTNDAKVAYLTNDHLGSPRINTDANGAVAARHDYLPFGEEISTAITAQRSAGVRYLDDTVRKQFTGYERDKEIGLDYAQARYFGSALGRFTTPDPYKIVAEIQNEQHSEKARNMLNEYLKQPQKWNRYVYVQNNPLRYVDPSGEDEVLTGSADDQKKALQRLKEELGEERWRYVHVTKL